MNCSSCGAEVRAGNRFCSNCAAPIGSNCPQCGTSVEPSDHFCGACAAPLGSPATQLEPPPSADKPVAERRLVSVLFADLVGFTSTSEDQDPEAVRDFLSQYFDTAREVIARYGGTVEKFIGDAVMAVWGAPTAHEDDAERTVRAALELVHSITHLEPPAGVPPAQLRAGVLTGEAAVTLGAEGQGMVAGDLVNTASRLQSAAPPGTVLVGPHTYHAAKGAIVFEEAGEQTLKGKALPVQAWRALRVVGKIRGGGRSELLEAPFVGRDEELRLLKDAYHATVREGKARLVSVIGQPGLGKSRLAWEFSKYTDGLAETMLWHEGRSPAYGEGVTFWALAEMVRRRAEIAETDDDATSRELLKACLVEYVPDVAERRWVEPALLALLGLDEAPAAEQEELFAAWRTFFERVSERGPTVMLFQDLHWADKGLLEFIEQMLDRAASRPILFLTFSRPDLLERYPQWGAGQRRFASIHLEPLVDEEMQRLLTGLAPGLSEGALGSILSRAEGVPLYAVETVRMLVDQGALVPEEGTYRLTDTIEQLAVPDTLHALIAARLDRLEASDRGLLQDAAVLGQSFTVEALAEIRNEDTPAVEIRLRELVRKEFLRQEVDPRSPERGQYQFVQALIREVAYGTLSKRDRRSRHLAAARFFEKLGEDELAGVLASHYLDAYRATPEGPEADAAAAQARIGLRAAAERAADLHSHDQAISYFEQALSVTSDPAATAVLYEEAGASARSIARWELAEDYFRKALTIYVEQQDDAATARLTAWIGAVLASTGRIEQAISWLEDATTRLAGRLDDRESAVLAADLARAYMFREEWSKAIATADRALIAAERHREVNVVIEALITKGTSLQETGRDLEAMAILQGALQLAQAHGHVGSELRARNNIAFLAAYDNPRLSLQMAREGLEVGRRIGLIHRWLLGNACEAAVHTGDWDWAMATSGELESDRLTYHERNLVLPVAIIHAARGDYGEAETWLRGLDESEHLDSDPAYRANLLHVRGQVSLIRGEYEVAARDADALANSKQHPFDAMGLLLRARTSLWMMDAGVCGESLEGVDALNMHWRFVEVTAMTLKAGLVALEGNQEEAATRYLEVAQLWRDELQLPFDLGLCLMDFATLLSGIEEGRAARDEARAIFTSLNSPPLLARLDAGLQPDHTGIATAART